MDVARTTSDCSAVMLLLAYLIFSMSGAITGYPVFTLEDPPTPCVGLRFKDIHLCMDNEGNFRIDEPRPRDNMIPVLHDRFPAYEPFSAGRADRFGSESSPLTDKRNLRRQPLLRSTLRGASKTNGSPLYLVKKPFDSITYNHDLAGFK